MSKQEKQNQEEFLRLIQENPELPICPMVDYEVVAEDGGRWLGAWGGSYIGEYLMGNEQVHFRDDSDLYEVDKVLEEMLNEESYEAIETDAEAHEAYAALPWIKAIIVDIELPG